MVGRDFLNDVGLAQELFVGSLFMFYWFGKTIQSIIV